MNDFELVANRYFISMKEFIDVCIMIGMSQKQINDYLRDMNHKALNSMFEGLK